MGEETLERFGKYFLLDKIGAGGMAEIFRARPASVDANGRIVVIKRMLRKVANDTSFLSMFKSEIQVCMGLNHPNIVQIHDFGEIGRQAYLVMEAIEGKNLKELIIGYSEENSRVPVELAAHLIAQAARGLDYAHGFQNNATGESLKIVHRDISPHNILVSYDGNVKIIDFGIAKARLKIAEHTQSGVIKGKIRYMSPEQVVGDDLDGRSDIFSLGIVLWELLAGKQLFDCPGKTEVDILRTIQACDTYVPLPSTMNSAVPPQLDAIVMKALEVRREARYSTAGELASALHAFLAVSHPHYSIAEVAGSLREVFKIDIMNDRDNLRELNEKAQLALATIEKQAKNLENSGSRLLAAGATGAHSLMNSRALGQRTYLFGKIPLPRKVTDKKLLFVLLYVLTILFIKLDQRYFFFDRFTLPSEYVQAMTAETARAKEQPKVAMQNIAETAAAFDRGDGASILMFIEMKPQHSEGATIMVNSEKVDATNPFVRVPLDKALSLVVTKAGFAPFKSNFVLKSGLYSEKKLFSMKVELNPLLKGAKAIRH